MGAFPVCFHRRWLAAPILGLAALGLLAGCSGDGEGALPASTSAAGATAPAAQPSPSFRGQAFADDGADFAADVEEAEEFSRAQSAPAMARDKDANGGAGESDFTLAQAVERRVISTASLVVTTDDVVAAATQAGQIVEGRGGYVESLSRSGDDRFARADLTLRVPQSEFSGALDQLRALGEVVSESLGSEDVTDQFIDLEARLRSAERAEASLLALLERANAVTDILTIERELARIRTDIERFQGQLNFLERRVALATIYMALQSPEADFSEAPEASLGVDVDRLERAVTQVKEIAAANGGEVVRSTIFIDDDEESASVTIVVPRDAFPTALSAVERVGRVEFKRLSEGQPGDPLPADAEPDAYIDVDLRTTPGGGDALILILAIVLPVAGVVVLAGGGLAIWLHRRSRPAV